MNRHSPTVAYVFGYGSLVSKESREATLGKSTTGVVIGKLASVKRSFDAISLGNSMLNHKYFTKGQDKQTGLDMLPAFKPAFCNARIVRNSNCLGAFIPVDRQGLSDFDDREGNYTRVDVSHLVPSEVLKQMGHNVPTYMYTAKITASARVADADVHIPSIYLDTVRAAYATITETFDGVDGLTDFNKSTDFCGLPIIDVGLPHYLEKY